MIDEKLKCLPQLLTLPIVNFSNGSVEEHFTRHSNLFGGKCKRGLIVGPSGVGKTNAMLSLLVARNGLRFLNLYLCSNSLYQNKYDFLRRLIEPIKDCGYYEFSNIDEFIRPEDAKEYSVVVFDDVSCTGQNVIKEFFSYGRHKNIDCFLICQSYSAIPKQLVRDNCNFLVLFKQDLTNLKHVFEDHIMSDMEFHRLKEISDACWENRHGILVIDLDCSVSKGRYRKGFDKFIEV